MLTASKVDVIADILNGVRNDAVLVPCKAAGLGWPAVEAILQNRDRDRQPSPQILELARKDYQRLSLETAQKTLRFSGPRHREVSAESARRSALTLRRYRAAPVMRAWCCLLQNSDNRFFGEFTENQKSFVACAQPWVLCATTNFHHQGTHA